MNPLGKIKAVFSPKEDASKNALVRVVDPVNLRSLNRGGSPVSRAGCIQELEPEEAYSGFIYAAIQRRAIAVADYICDNLETQRRGATVEVERQEDNHQYINLWKKNPDWTMHEFMQISSIMLDLTGDSFTGVERGFIDLESGGRKMRATRGFTPLRSYYVHPKVDSDGNLVYWEYNRPNTNLKYKYETEQMVHIREVNPFEEILGHSLMSGSAVAAFVDRESSETTASALRNNLSASGFLTLENNLNEDQAENLKQDLEQRYSGNRGTGRPIVIAGQNSSFQSISYDLNKMALETIKSLSREEITAVYGVSKTILGIEQSGVTRDTARVQKDIFFEHHVRPRARKIIEAFNRDYNRLSISNRQVELGFSKQEDPEKMMKLAELEGVKLDNARKMYELGVSREYIQREVLQITEANVFDHEPEVIGQQEREVVLAPRTTSNSAIKKTEESFLDVVQNALKPAQYNAIVTAQERLRKDVVKWHENYMKKVLTDIKSNNLSVDEEKTLVEQLVDAFTSFNKIVFPVFLRQHGRDNASKFAKKFVETELSSSNLAGLTRRAKAVALSHQQDVAEQLAIIISEAEEKALTRTKVAKQVRDLFKERISKTNALRIAVTETSYAYNEARHIENVQFINRHGLQNAHYVWRTNSSNPDAVCRRLAGTKVAASKQKFYSPGDKVKATEADGREVTISTWEHSSGRPPVHPNCMCSIDLVVEG